MTTLFNAHTQGTGEGSLSSREGKRNRKAQALSALLSASALGVFLEGCGGERSLNTQTRQSGESQYEVRPRDNFLIDDSDSSNTVRFDTNRRGTVYTEADFTFTRSGDNLIIEAVSIKNQGPIRVEIEDYFPNGGERFTFVLNSSETYDIGDRDVTLDVPPDADIPEASAAVTSAVILADASGVTVIVGSEDGEDLSGGEGVDILQGLGGADTLDGDEGADTLVGGTGADTYVFAEGDGADTIVEVGEEGVVNIVKFEGDYQASDFSFVRGGEDGTDLVIVVDTDGDKHAENEVTLDGYFVYEASTETAYSIEVQINNEEAFVPAVEG